MKFTRIKDVKKFFEMIDTCKGEVALVSNDGDRIVLTSKLSRFIIEVLNNNEMLNELELYASEKDDIEKIVTFVAEQ